MILKMKSQKRAMDSSTGALSRSQSKDGDVVSADDKRAMLKKRLAKRLESFNNLKTEKEDESSAGAACHGQKREQKQAVSFLKIDQTRSVPRDALLDNDSADVEISLVNQKKETDFSVGEDLQAKYVDDGLW